MTSWSHGDEIQTFGTDPDPQTQTDHRVIKLLSASLTGLDFYKPTGQIIKDKLLLSDQEAGKHRNDSSVTRSCSDGHS